jgi:putative PIN family toxin of toxin-antitoxin system
MPPIAVFDTNVLISAVGWNGPSRRCLELAEQGKFQVVVCESILEEFASIRLKRLRFSEPQILSCVQSLIGFVRIATIAENLHGAYSDPKDDKILECAMAAKATHIVSGDKKHLLAMGTYENILILAPRDFLALLESETNAP